MWKLLIIIECFK